jgi:hypothetical protein
LSVDGCTLARSCSICSDFSLDTGSFCTEPNQSITTMTVAQLPVSSDPTLSRPSTAYLLSSLCTPPSPSVAVCLMSDGSDSYNGLMNISWLLQPVLVTRLLLTVYFVDHTGHMTVIHNTSVTVSPQYISLPLPLGPSCCLVSRSSTASNLFSAPTTPICGLQVTCVHLILQSEIIFTAVDRLLLLFISCPHILFLHFTYSAFRYPSACLLLELF